ncbi:MAG: HlyD family efflux transporter periplasmic adaptor subunit [Rhodobacteraceae bacterium]|nr:HlyD family efflux transporter periplasmic adaptor subunit [Paracoccaceae bacterium]
MRFLKRGLIGLLLLAIMTGSLGYGVYRVTVALKKEEKAFRPRVTERSYSVNTATFRSETVRPTTAAYGQIESWRTLEIRASSAGKLVEALPVFRDGASVGKGEVLVTIDPADAKSSLLDARAALADAEAQKAEADEALVAAEFELKSTRKQMEVRQQSLARTQEMRGKGYSTAGDVEELELAIASLEQSISGQRQALVTARKNIERMELNVERAKITVQDAERTLSETKVVAPFSGMLDGVDATLGRRVAASEALATLIDPTALEVSFSVSTDQFSRFLDDSGRLLNVPLHVILQLGGREVETTGRLERVAAIVGEGEAGRKLYGSLDVPDGSLLRPGDFVEVKVQEPALENVVRIPSAATNEDGQMLVITEDNRLEEIEVTVLRRMKDEVIVSDAPIGRDYVIKRLPQLGKGLKVEPRNIDVDDQAPSAAGDKAVDASGASADTPIDESSFVTLEPARRAALIAMLKDSAMPQQRKDTLLETLRQDKVPLEIVKRLEGRSVETETRG